MVGFTRMDSVGLMAFYHFRGHLLIIAALLTRNSRVPSALADAWIALGAGLLILLALFAKVIVFPALPPTISDQLFLAYGFV